MKVRSDLRFPLTFTCSAARPVSMTDRKSPSNSPVDRCPVGPPPHSCLRSGPIRIRRVTFSQDTRLCAPTDLSNVNQRPQEVDVSDVLLRDGRGFTRSRSLQSDRTAPPRVGVSEMSAVLGGLLQLVERHWDGPGSLQRDQRFLGGAYDLLSELLQPEGGGGPRDGGSAGIRLMSQGTELVLLRRKLEKTEHLLETMETRLVSTLRENFQLKHQLSSEQQTS